MLTWEVTAGGIPLSAARFPANREADNRGPLWLVLARRWAAMDRCLDFFRAWGNR